MENQPPRRSGAWDCDGGNYFAREGIGGISTGSDLLVAKGIDESGTGTDEGIAQAVDWCVENGADIISLSLGGIKARAWPGLPLTCLSPPFRMPLMKAFSS